MATTWTLDPTHSELQFKVKHLMITNVTGTFKNFDLAVETDSADFKHANKIEFTADINSIDTNNEQRDTHLKSADFFDAASHPELKFVSTKMEKVDGENFVLLGNLTIREVTKPVKFDVTYGGTINTGRGEKAGFKIVGKINRQDYGLTWSNKTPTGELVVGDEVDIIGKIELDKKA